MTLLLPKLLPILRGLKSLELDIWLHCIHFRDILWTEVSSTPRRVPPVTLTPASFLYFMLMPEESSTSEDLYFCYRALDPWWRMIGSSSGEI